MSSMTFTKAALLSLSFMAISGCSSMDATVNSIANGMNKLSDWTDFQTVEVAQLDQDYFKLQTKVDEGLISFSNRSLRHAAKQACPKGYVLESQQALNNGALLNSQCSGNSCQHDLTWVIRCKELAEEPFSIFGKT